MPVDAQHPGNIGGDLIFEFEDGVGECRDLGLALGGNLGLSSVEQDFGLENEPVAHNLNIRTAL